MSSSPYALKISPEQAKEIPMVDLAFLILKEANTPFYYRDLMNEIAKIRGISEDEVLDVIAQVYTEINIDGRFACVGNNLWGLKRWYPVDKSEDGVGNMQRPRIINDDDDDDLDDDHLFDNEEDNKLDEDQDDDLELDEDLEDDEDVDLDEEDLDEELDEDDLDEELDEELDEDLDEDDDSLEED